MNKGRREFLRNLSLAGLGASAAGLSGTRKVYGSNLHGTVLLEGGRDFSPTTGKERKRVASACWQ